VEENTMKRALALFATAAAIGLVSGLVSPPAAVGDEPKPPTEAFHEIVQNLIDAENNEDAAAMTALFAENAILLPPGGEAPIEGTDNIRSFLNNYAKHKMNNHKITPTILMLGGPESMIDAGTWSGDVPAQNGGQATHVTGTYLAVGILVDGQWKLWADSWQVKPPTDVSGSSTPPQAGTTTPTPQK
jgi:uncharacterized protein (TIGR02246 family)